MNNFSKVQQNKTKINLCRNGKGTIVAIILHYHVLNRIYFSMCKFWQVAYTLTIIPYNA
jgi:hypothetical protein